VRKNTAHSSSPGTPTVKKTSCQSLNLQEAEDLPARPMTGL